MKPKPASEILLLECPVGAGHLLPERKFMIIQQIIDRILNDERIGQRVREILQEELSDDNNAVYITETGTTYHRKKCNQMEKGAKQHKQCPQEVSLSAVIEVGYTPCPHCNPPNLIQNTP